MTGGKPLLTNFSTCHRIECCAKAEISLFTTLRMLQKHFFHFQEGGNGQCHDFVIYFFQAQSHLSCSTYTAYGWNSNDARFSISGGPKKRRVELFAKIIQSPRELSAPN